MLILLIFYVAYILSWKFIKDFEKANKISSVIGILGLFNYWISGEVTIDEFEKNFLGILTAVPLVFLLTNYLATANLVSLCEALTTAKKIGMDLGTTYEAIRISSGNSFVHETESQVILNGSRDINFTMDLVLKDINLFQSIADRAGVPLEISPLLIDIFKDGEQRFGSREWSSNIIRRLEETCETQILASGFPPQMVDDESEVSGKEVIVR